MNTTIYHLVDGAKQAKGATVIIDVFRAFTVEAYLCAFGASKVVPVGDKDVAYKQKENDPDVILIGERKGIKLPGFDFGNSPTEIQGTDFTGKTVVHTTSAGTQGVANASGADEIFVASLVNAKATAQYILSQGYETVSIVAMGLLGSTMSDEDELCAKYIKSVLDGNEIDIKDEIAALKYTFGAKFFDKEKQHIYPQDDFYYCTELNRFSFAMKVETDSKTGLLETKRIDVKEKKC